MPSAEAVEMVLAGVPGVADATVTSRGQSRGTLRIRVAEGFDPHAVAEQVSTTLRERFAINIPPEALLDASTPHPEDAPAAAAPDRGEPVVLYDASRAEAPPKAVGMDLPGWDAVLIRAQESAAKVATSAAIAAATRPVTTGPEPVSGPVLAPVPDPVQGELPSLLTDVGRVTPWTTDAEVSGIRFVDAAVEGIGGGRRAIVIVSRNSQGAERRGIGAALVGDGDDAGAIAKATLAAIRDLLSP